MVNDSLSLAPAVERVTVVCGDGSLPGAVHQGVKFAENHLLVRLGVEIARENHGISLRIHLLDTVHDEFQSLFLGYRAHVVEVGVDEVELAAGLLVFHQGPGGCPHAGGIPAHGRLFRSLRKPVCSPLEKGHLLSVVEDGHVLSLALAVLASYSHAFVSVAVLVHVLDLEIVCFLYSENVRFLVGYHHCGSGISVFPGVGSVLGDAHPDVVGHHGNLGRLVVLRGNNEAGRKGQCQNDCKSFHDFNVSYRSRGQMTNYCFSSL